MARGLTKDDVREVFETFLAGITIPTVSDGRPVPVAHHVQELTPLGVRQLALRCAGKTHEILAGATAGLEEAHLFTADDVLADARKYEAYLLGSDPAVDREEQASVSDGHPDAPL